MSHLWALLGLPPWTELPGSQWIAGVDGCYPDLCTRNILGPEEGKLLESEVGSILAQGSQDGAETPSTPSGAPCFSASLHGGRGLVEQLGLGVVCIGDWKEKEFGASQVWGVIPAPAGSHGSAGISTAVSGSWGVEVKFAVKMCLFYAQLMQP